MGKFNTISVSVVILLLAVLNAVSQTDKTYKDPKEYDAYEAVTKDFAAKNFTKAIADLNFWRETYPDSAFQQDRQLLYVEAYLGADRPAEAIDAAAPLLRDGAPELTASPADIIRWLYAVSTGILRLPEPTTEQLAIADTAAHRLLAYDKGPDGVAADAWLQMRGQLQTAAKGSLIYVTLVPVAGSLKSSDCTAAETGAKAALDRYPESAQAAWYLGSAELCLYKQHPERASMALYEFARAAALDPTKGLVDPKWQQSVAEPNLEKIYKQYHGEDPEGLKQLKELAVTYPLPPAEFHVKSANEIAQEKQAEFESTNPELALWLKIKSALSDANGEQYFASDLKDANVPQLYGVVVEAKPACRPRELLVAVRTPDSAAGVPEITLKLNRPLAGKPEQNSPFRWEGTATKFTKDPFMLTMEVDVTKIAGLKISTCDGPVRRHAPR